jgi:gliding motility-associated-like protein
MKRYLLFIFLVTIFLNLHNGLSAQSNQTAAIPQIIENGELQPLLTVYGTASSTTSFMVSGTALTAAVSITAPAGFEFSNDGINFSASINLSVTTVIGGVTVYMRLSATAPAEIYSGDVVLASSGATSVYLPTAGSIVKPAPLTIIANNQSKVAGTANPPLTASYRGFVNNETAADLTEQPTISTTAVTLSPPGTYPITVTGAQNSNYNFIYVAGMLTINAVPPSIVVPNAFTPNNDGVNDTWGLKNMESFPQNRVDIYNRYGERVYSSNGYAVPWDGRRNGAPLPVGAYYYVINPNNGSKIISGSVTIIR